MFQDKIYRVEVGAFSVLALGFVRAEASGEVFNLKRIEDFDGTYTAVSIEGTLASGAGANGGDSHRHRRDAHRHRGGAARRRRRRQRRGGGRAGHERAGQPTQARAGARAHRDVRGRSRRALRRRAAGPAGRSQADHRQRDLHRGRRWLHRRPFERGAELNRFSFIGFGEDLAKGSAPASRAQDRHVLVRVFRPAE